MFEHIDLEVRGPVGWYRYDRPPRNVFHWPMMQELLPALESLLERPEVRVVVIGSTTPGAFSSGADLQSYRDADSQTLMKWVHIAHDLVRALRGSPKPILAAIDGTAVGGGLEITYHADLRFAGADARLGQPEINLAFIPPIAGTQALVRLIGHGRAFRMLTEGTLIGAQEAHEIGLVDMVCPAETLIDEVQAYAEKLAEKPANALAAIRKCLIEGGDHRFADGMTLELAEVGELMSHPNFAEGVAAFLERRKPDWV